MRLHVVALPHTETTEKYLHCAYTQKVVKFADMMTARGHEVYIYGAGEENEANCVEHISLVSPNEQLRWFGAWDEQSLWGQVDWSPNATPWVVMNARAVEAIRERADQRDLVLLTMGLSQKPIADALSHMISVEWAVGYEGIAIEHRIFESYAWMHYLYGRWYQDEDGKPFDAVVPNYFDPEHFYAVDDPARPTREDFLLYIGRVISRKGVEEALEVARRAERKLVVVGPGVRHHQQGEIITGEFLLKGDVEYAGVAGIEERKDLLARAHAVLTPTRYIEPFGGTAVEAMMSGTPSIATDWGAFTETVLEGVSGYRMRTIREGVQAVERVAHLDPQTIQDYARSRYSLDAVAPQFERVFDRLQTRWGSGFYE